MRKIAADKIYTINDGIIENGVIVIDNENKILAISSQDKFDKTELEIYKGSLCPGFINAHCHLELSHLKNKITPNTGLVNFIEQLIKIRFEQSVDERLYAIANAEAEMYNNGIIAVGDISNEEISLYQKTKQNLYYHTFIETIGLNPSIALQKFEEAQVLSSKFRNKELVNTIAPHAPYSTSIQLQKLIFDLNQISTIHNQESIEEAKFFENKSGDFVNFYKSIHVDISFFQATRKNSLQSIATVLPINANMLFVHNSFSNQSDVDLIKVINPNAYLCACINANLYIENRIPNILYWVNNFKNICIGTDSLASNNTLSIWDEIKSIQLHFPTIALNTLLKFATLNGARFLKIDDWAGSFEVGKKPGINLIWNDSIKRIV